jgi:hypothetical protein
MRAMQGLNMHYPEVHEDERRHFDELRRRLEADSGE